MADVAQLGFQINTAPVNAATQALHNLTGAANATTAAVNTLTQVIANQTAKVTQHGAAATKAAQQHGVLSAALKTINYQLVSLAAGLGPVEVFLSALGPAGFVAAAGLGLVQKIFNDISEGATRLGEKAVEVRAFGVATGLTVGQIAELKRIAHEFGISGDELTTRIERLTNGLEAAQRGGGPLYEALQRVGAGFAKQLGEAQNLGDALVVIGKATEAAGDATTRAALATDAFGRGGAAFVPVLLKLAEGLHSVSDATDELGLKTTDQVNKFAELQTTIEQLRKQNQNILDQIFAEDGLQAQKFALEQQVKFNKALLESVQQMREFTFWEKVFASIAAGLQVGGPGPDAGIVAAQQEAIARRGLAAKPEDVKSWNDLEDAMNRATKAANDNTTANKGNEDSLAKQQQAAARAASSQKQYVDFLGPAATAQEKLSAQLTELQSKYLDNKTGIEDVTQASIALKRAQDALQLNAQVANVSALVSALGPLATVEQKVAEKMLQVAKSNMEFNNLTPAQIQAIKNITTATENGTIAMKQQADTLRIEAATVGMSTGQAAAYRAEQEKVLEAKRTGVSVSEATQQAWHNEAQAIGGAADAAERAKVAYDIKRERQLALLSPDEVAIAEKLKSLYPEVATALNSPEAAALRFNAALKKINEEAGTFASTFLTNLASGKSVIESLNDAAQQLAKTLIDVASKQLVSSALSGAFGGAASTAGPAASLTSAATAVSGSLTLGATEAASTLTAAGATVSGAFISGATEARAILDGVVADVSTVLPAAGAETAGEIEAGTTVAATELPVAGAEVEGEITAGAAALTAAGTAAGTALWGPAGPILAALGAIAAGFGISKILGGQSSKKQEQEQAQQQAVSGYEKAVRDHIQDLEDEGKAQEAAAYATSQQATIQQAYAQGLITQQQGMQLLTEVQDAAKQATAGYAKQQEELNKRLEDYSDRVLAATTDTSTLAGQLAEFDRKAARERETEVAAGGEALVQLEAAQAAERLQIQYNYQQKLNAEQAQAAADLERKIEAIQQRQKSFQDRLFAATTDTSTLAGQLAAFDRKAAQEREDEIKAGGEAINDLEAALGAERLKIVNDYNKQIIDAQKSAFKQILDYVEGLKFGALSTLSPEQKLRAAQEAYNKELALAQAGNQDALNNITKVADTFLQAEKDFYASSEQYSKAFTQVTSDLTNLATGTQQPGMQQGGVVGYATGGVVGGGIYNKDSVAAQLAGGEFVTKATSVNPETLPLLEQINAMGAANDNRQNFADLSRTFVNVGNALATRLERLEEAYRESGQRAEDATRIAVNRTQRPGKMTAA